MKDRLKNYLKKFWGCIVCAAMFVSGLFRKLCCGRRKLLIDKVTIKIKNNIICIGNPGEPPVIRSMAEDGLLNGCPWAGILGTSSGKPGRDGKDGRDGIDIMAR